MNEFLFGFMPEKEWDRYVRNSKIEVNGRMIDYPLESNIWQMEIGAQVEYLKAIAAAGCNTGMEMPVKFAEWISWKLGDRVAEDYMIPYNEKLFGKEFESLGTYWLEKLPNVSFEETLRSCLERKAYGKKPGHTEFYYPKRYGYGELWLRMADALGDHIKYNQTVKGIDFVSKMAATVDNQKYSADRIVSTIPWMEFHELNGMPEDMKETIKELKFNSVQIEYCAGRIDTDAHWIYYPNLNLPYHRILVRHNFCPGSTGYWTETNSERVEAVRDNKKIRHMNRYAYPLNTVGKPEVMERFLAWSKRMGVIGLGRWGGHRHYNSDVTVERAMTLAEQIIYERRFTQY